MATESEISDVLNRQVRTVNQSVLDMLKAASEIAAKGPSILMMSLGTTLIMLGIIFKLDIHGFHMASLSLGELIVIFAFGFLLIVGGAAIKVYEYYVSVVLVTRQQQKLGADLLKNTTDFAREIIKNSPKPSGPL